MQKKTIMLDLDDCLGRIRRFPHPRSATDAFFYALTLIESSCANEDSGLYAPPQEVNIGGRDHLVKLRDALTEILDDE